MREIVIHPIPSDPLCVAAVDSQTGRMAFANALDEDADTFLELGRIAYARLTAILEIEGEE